jgi:dihydroorotase
MRLAIRGGRLIDPANQIDAVKDLFVTHHRVVAIGDEPAGFQADREIDAHGQVVCPGLIDLCARPREPGQEHQANIASETRAAARGGITTLVCPPDTDPVIDETAVVELIRRRSQAAGQARVLTLGALTRGLESEQLAEMAALKEAGCVGMSNALSPITNTLVLRRSLEYAATYNLAVFLTPIDPWLSAGGHAHEGAMATRLGLNGIPVAAETSTLARDLALVEDIGVRAHFGRLSSARAVDMVAAAQARGLPVSADTSAHHLHLSDTNLANFNSCCHVIPPLRGPQDKQRLRDGVAGNTLGAICSDHQPHEPDAKEVPFGDSLPGVSGLDTLLALSLRLVAEGLLPLSTAIERLTVGPARILGLDLGHLSVSAMADICIFDPKTEWRLTAETINSRGHNSPFLNRRFQGRTTYTLLAGKVVYEAPSRLE